MKHLEDKRLCPHCGKPVHRQPYLMARQATENVLSSQFIALVLAFVAALTVFSLVS